MSPNNKASTLILFYCDNAYEAFPSLRALISAINLASQENIKSKIIVIINKSDTESAEAIKHYKESLRMPIDAIIPISDERDISQIAKKEKNDYVMIIKSNWLINKHFILVAVKTLKACVNRKVLIHPEYSVNYGMVSNWSHHQNQKQFGLKLINLVNKTYWPFAFITRLESFVAATTKTPFYFNMSNNLFISSGYEFAIAPDSSIFIHQSNNKQYEDQFTSTSVIRAIYRDLTHAHPNLKPNAKAFKLRNICDLIKIKLTSLVYYITVYVLKQIRGSSFYWKLRKYADLFLGSSPILRKLFFLLNPSISKKSFISINVPKLLQLHSSELSAHDPRLSHYFEINDSIQNKSLEIIPTENAILGVILASLKNIDYSHIFIVPDTSTGGVSLALTHHVKLIKKSLSIKPLVIITNKQYNIKSTKLNTLADIIILDNLLPKNSKFEKEYILASLLIQLAPKTLHIINSDLAFRTIVKYGEIISNHSKIFVSFYADWYNYLGELTGYAKIYLQDAYRWISGIISDNSVYPTQLQELFGYPNNKFHTIYFPSCINIDKKKNKILKDNLPKKILWVGRITKGKRLDIVIKLAQLMKEIEFDIWGEKSPDYQLSKIPRNIHFKGSFNNFEAIPINQYNIFLFTSEMEGLPNVLLEAISSGLIVIASNVGGVSDIITESTGYPITNIEDVTEYAQAINEIFNHPDQATKKILNAQNLIKQRHSWSHFDNSMMKVKNYI